MILALFLTGCSAFEQQMGAFKKDDQLYCHPVTDLGNECTGYMLDKPVIITEEEIEYETTNSQEESST
jgi:hypothetical protein